MKTRVLTVNAAYPEIDRIAVCAKIIRQGGLVIFPTETVYGIAADMDNKDAMQRLRYVKRRSENKPFAMLVSSRSSIMNLTNHKEPILFKLIDKFWPGPLTVVVPSKRTSGTTIGVRMPDHMVALRLVQESGCPIAAPSANLEGKEAPKTCEEALTDLDGLVDIALDAGPTRIGIGSSVVDFTFPQPKVIREGVITQDEVDRITKQKTILFVCTGNSCRSVMAEYLLKKYLGDRKDIEVISSGTGVFIRSQASHETIEVLRREGVDATFHQSQSINPIMLKKADLILVMTRAHRFQVLDKSPDVEKRVYLLKEFANIPKGSETDLDIPDPIGRSPQAYEECLWIIKEAIQKIVKLL